MSDRIDYPPTREYTLEAALESVKADIENGQAEIDDLEAKLPDGDEDPDPATTKALREARQRKSTVESYRDALKWAIGEWGEDAKIEIRGIDTNARKQVQKALRTGWMGEATTEDLNHYLIAESLMDAPWVQPDDDIHDLAGFLDELPPGLSDWIEDEMDDLNDLGN